MRKPLLNGLLKSFEFKKPIPINRRKLIISLILGSMLVGTPIATSQLQTFDTNLVNQNTSKSIATQLNADTTYMGNNSRFIAPKNAPIYVNIAISDLTDEQMSAMYDAISQLNTVCNTINPNYSLEIRFNPSQRELNDLYTINVYKKDLEKDKLGNALSLVKIPTSTGMGIYKSKIQLDDSLFKNKLTQEDYNTLKNTLIHETSHTLLELKDAYLINNYTTSTIMQKADSWQIPFSVNDLKIFQAKLAPTATDLTDINQLYKTLLPQKEIQEQIDYVKSHVTPEFLSKYFRNEAYLDSEISFDSLGTVCASNHQQVQVPIINSDGSESHKTYSTTQLYKFDNTVTEYIRHDLNSQGSQLHKVEFNNAVLNNVIFTENNQIVARINDEILLISLETNEESNSTRIEIQRLKNVSQEEYLKQANALQKQQIMTMLDKK